MDNNATQELTQPATQPTLRQSMYAVQYQKDMICVLRANPTAALRIVANAARDTPQHVLFEPERGGHSDEGVHRDDGKEASNRRRVRRRPLSIALRTSSKVRDLTMGFVFGREENKSDIVFKTGMEDSRVSSKHFRIFLNDAQILMIEDHSTNGTQVDSQLLAWKKDINSKRLLTEGSSISVAVYGDRSTRTISYATFTVSLPERDVDIYSRNLQSYVQRVSEAKNAKRLPGEPPSNFGFMPSALMTASTEKYHYGMHWNGAPTYRVLGKVGSGAFATVYKIANLDGEPFAAKEIDIKKVAKDGIMAQNLNNELSIVKRLSHPHIVKFCNWKETTNWLYIIMEYVPCGDLSRYTVETSLLPRGNIKQVAHQICQALHHIHSLGITHRDIKPENILIASTDPLTVKLTDFGLSKVVRTDDLTMLKTFCGTLLYCAPEVYPEFERLRSGAPRLRQRPPRSSPYSSAVDIWSFGAVLYQLLVARPPVKGAKDGADMLDAILHGKIDFDCLKRVDLNEDGFDYLTRMLAIDACDRIDAESCLWHPWLMDLNNNNPLVVTTRRSAASGKTLEMNTTGYTDTAKARPRRKRERKAARAAGPSESFTQAAAGLIDPKAKRIDASAAPTTGSPKTDPPHEDEDPSQWSPREPRVHAGGSDSDEILPDVQGLANDIVAEVPDSVSGASELGRSLIAPLAPDRARALRRQNENQGTTGRLFGELTTSGAAESGIFGREARPTIRQNNRKHRTSSLHGAEKQMDVLQVSPPQDKGEAGLGRAPYTPLPKRILELSDDHDEAAKASKRSMTRNYRTPSTQSVSFAGPIVHGQRMLGRLKPCPGSITTQNVEIFKPCMRWGRAPACSHQWPDPADTRIPKCGIEITFFRPGLWDNFGGPSSQHLDEELRDSDALISTRCQYGIRINGVRLKDRGDCPKSILCAKLRSGDIIELLNKDGDFLSYECEFYVSRSAAIRTDDEPFLTENNIGLAAVLSGRQAQREAAAAQAPTAASGTATAAGSGSGAGKVRVTPAVA